MTALNPSRAVSAMNSAHFAGVAAGRDRLIRSSGPAPGDVAGERVDVLDPAESTMYLGKLLCLTEVHDTEIRHRISKAWSKFAVYKDELCNKKYELNHRLRLFDSVITPTILYGSGTWTMGRDRENTLRGTQRKMLRKVLGSGRREKEPSEESASALEASGDTVSQLSENTRWKHGQNRSRE